ncbi:MAG TPA: glycosyltransferase [Phycisphaerae bacterium]|nr:glycosyltransferase [Phycisphaerae bacterium]HOJ74443.1 glycosyltransferase [Phycisphaerae bacterium]HOM52932.1 glycosyltransferase [Phycisphaerae bacterium]HON66487.1 glycosyltransferase [Phycisphaerae bacterium]HOQ86000.1 glycosyltransferase [Phycisphaerae bacterium]
MIFVTVGAQMPFDRLIRVVDEWAGRHQRTDVFAQIGQAQYQPRHIRSCESMGPDEFHATLEAANAVVAHAGMGSIISAVERRKPILVMPRRSDLGETRNDHQVATARQFGALGLVEVAMDEHELAAKLERIDELQAAPGPDGRASPHCVMCPFADKPERCAQRAVTSACPHLLSAVHAFLAEEHPAIEQYAIAPAAAGIA